MYNNCSKYNNKIPRNWNAKYSHSFLSLTEMRKFLHSNEFFPFCWIVHVHLHKIFQFQLTITNLLERSYNYSFDCCYFLYWNIYVLIDLATHEPVLKLHERPSNLFMIYFFFTRFFLNISEYDYNRCFVSVLPVVNSICQEFIIDRNLIL